MKKNYHIDDTFLARWLKNELTEEELSDFKNSEDYALYQKIATKSKEFKVPSFDEEKTFEQIQYKLSHQKTKVKNLIPNWVYATAIAAVLLLGFFLFKNNKTVVEVNIGEQIAYILPDGSEVLLNGNSKMTFVEKKWENNKRTLELEGEGYFKVKKGSTFAVKTPEGIVTVLGTQFNVQTVSGYLAVECYEGKVNVKSNVHETLLTPGKGVKFTKSDKKPYNVYQNVPNWTANIYQYNAVPLRVVFKDLENLYKVKVKNNQVDLNQLYTGKLIKNNLKKALEIICKPMDIQFTIDKKVVTISK